MNFELFFSPISEEVLSTAENTFGFQVTAFTEDIPNWEDANLVIVGIPEYRGKNQENNASLDAIRKSFYQLKNNLEGITIADLGNLNPGPTLEDTYLRLQEVIAFILQQNCLPILIGGSHDLTYGHYLGHVAAEQHVHLVNIDSQLDLGIVDTENTEYSFLEKIFVHKPNHLFGYTHLGYHSFQTDEDEITTLNNLGFDCIRVGDLKGKITEAEPYIRAADFVSFDIQAVRAGDSPVSNSPFGFSSEEACQMAWYAGQNNQLHSLGLYGYNEVEDQKGRSAAILATMIWYFIEGYYCRQGEKNVLDSHYTKYLVSFDSEEINFYKDNISDKWWMEVKTDASNKLVRNTLVPCSYADYQEAMQGKIPERWMQAQNKA